jgi:hypothetical protein
MKYIHAKNDAFFYLMCMLFSQQQKNKNLFYL